MPPRFAWTLLLWSAAFLSAAGSPRARAQDIDCSKRWSIFRPTPDACLGPIETDRPHLTETPHPVAAGHVQLESGLVLVDTFGGQRDRLFFLENIYKVGIVTGIDLELLHTHLTTAGGTLAFARAQPIILRAKLQVMDADGLIPVLSVVPVVSIPLVEGHPLEPGLLVYAAWELPWGMELEVNAGLTVLAQRPLRGLSPLAASALTTPLWGALGGFVELYCIGPHQPRDPWDVLAGGGLVWLAHPDVQLDAGAWLGITGDVSPIIPFVGISFRR